MKPDTEIRRAILELVRRKGRATPSEVGEALSEVPASTVRTTMSRMEKDGELSRPARGVYTPPESGEPSGTGGTLRSVDVSREAALGGDKEVPRDAYMVFRDSSGRVRGYLRMIVEWTLPYEADADAVLAGTKVTNTADV